MMNRHKNVQWQLPTKSDGQIESTELAQLATLMDIRDELQTLNRLLGCENFRDIPGLLRLIRSNTAKPKKRKRVTR